MKTKLPAPEWIKNRFKKEAYFMDGDKVAIAVEVTDKSDSENIRKYWDIAVVRVNCDYDYFNLVNDATGESFDDWEWWDVDYYMKIDSYGPMTKKQCESL